MEIAIFEDMAFPALIQKVEELIADLRNNYLSCV